MSALVMLTPEEVETIRTGSLEDPTYIPFPSGRRARMEREEERRAEEEEREPEPITLGESAIIERTFAAQYWTRYALELAILLAPLTPGNPGNYPDLMPENEKLMRILTGYSGADLEGFSRRPQDFRRLTNRALEIVGLARIRGGPRGKIFGTRRVTIGPWELLTPPVQLDDVTSRLTSPQQRKLQEVLDGRTRPLPPRLNTAFVRALSQFNPDVIEYARSLTRPEPRSRRVRDSLEQRDANQQH